MAKWIHIYKWIFSAISTFAIIEETSLEEKGDILQQWYQKIGRYIPNCTNTRYAANIYIKKDLLCVNELVSVKVLYVYKFPYLRISSYQKSLYPIRPNLWLSIPYIAEIVSLSFFLCCSRGLFNLNACYAEC